MAFGFGSALDSIGDAVSDLGAAVGLNNSPNPNKPKDPIYTAAKNANVFGSNKKAPWEIVGTDWHKVYSYQFVVRESNEDDTAAAATPQASGSLWSTITSTVSAAFAAAPSQASNALGTGGAGDAGNIYYYALPIPPQTYVEKMVTASQATPTFGGVVEETNKNVFFNISMGGTTGIAVTRGATNVPGGRDKMASIFRDSIKSTGLMSGAMAQVNAVISQVGGIADQAIQAGTALANGDIGGAAAAAVQAMQTKLLPAMPYAGSAVDKDTNGFTEAEELVRFLYTYSALKDKKPDKYSLSFRNFKTGREYRCVVRDIQLQRSVQDPMLTRYSLALQCWDAKPISDSDKSEAEYDRFGPGGDLYPSVLINLDQMYKLNVAMSSDYSADDTVGVLLG